MALAELRYAGKALQKMTGAMVILPEREDFKGPFPVFYLLHGLSDDYTMWTRMARIEQYAADYPLIVVMPDGGRDFYTDAIEGDAYAAAIIHDLIGLVDRTFNTDPRREGRVIGGLSMGGYGAVRLALSRPDLFRSAVSHSGGLGAGGIHLDSVRPKEGFDYLADQHFRRAYGRRPERPFRPGRAGGPRPPSRLAP